MFLPAQPQGCTRELCRKLVGRNAAYSAKIFSASPIPMWRLTAAALALRARSEPKPPYGLRCRCSRFEEHISEQARLTSCSMSSSCFAPRRHGRSCPQAATLCCASTSEALANLSKVALSRQRMRIRPVPQAQMQSSLETGCRPWGGMIEGHFRTGHEQVKFGSLGLRHPSPTWR